LAPVSMCQRRVGPSPRSPRFSASTVAGTPLSACRRRARWVAPPPRAPAAIGVTPMTDPSDDRPKGPQDPAALRPEPAELRARPHATADAGRPAAVEKRRRTGQRTTRENIADLVDPGSFVEYGALALAAQRTRHTIDDLVKLSPADGIVCGV